MPKALTAAILIFITIFGLFFLVSPKYHKWGDLRQKQESKELLLREKQSYFSKLGQLSHRLQAKEGTLSKIDSALPSKPETSRLLNFLSETAKNNGLLLTKIGPITKSQVSSGEQQVGKGQEEKPVLKEITFSFKLLGDYPSLKNFLTAVEKSARLIEIENLSFSSKKPGLFQFNLTAKVHSY